MKRQVVVVQLIREVQLILLTFSQYTLPVQYNALEERDFKARCLLSQFSAV
jgi:hypothetical protein